jgi:peptidoglycan/LPS O-acetylase OafA/YrhL
LQSHLHSFGPSPTGFLSDSANPSPAASSRRTKPGLYQPLGWFRLLLAGMVLATHFSQNIGSPLIRDAIFPLCIAMIGVSCFFTLSGFIIAEAMQSFYVERPFAFIINRLLRIIPPLVGALILASFVYYALYLCGVLKLFHGMQQSNHAAFGPLNVLRNLASLLPLPKEFLRPDIDAIPVLWTLRIELMFYAVMFGAAVIASVLARLQVCRYQKAMNGLLVAMAVLCLVGVIARMAGKAPDLVSYFAWFGLGVALFFIKAGYKPAWGFAAAFLLASVWQFVAVQIAGRAAYQFNPLLIGQPVSPFAPTVILVGCLGIIAATSSLRFGRYRAIDRALGNLTYPLYLNHVTAGVLVLSLCEPGLSAMLIASALAVVVSLIMDRAVEPISTKWRTRLRGAALD